MADPARGPAVLVMARVPRPSAEPGPLEAALGSQRWSALQEALLSRVITWAQEVSPEGIYVAFEPPEAGADAGEAGAGGGEAGAGGGELAGPDVTTFPQEGSDMTQRLARAAGRVFEAGHTPVLIAWPDLPHWRLDHAAGALSDLADGCGISVGPVFDGGFYLVALAGPLAPLFELPPRTWRGADGMVLAFEAAHSAGIEVGLLRAERGLHSLEDMRAALADPLLDPELRDLLPSAE
jgi:glycosyltransferase A (GT-A) superfamily protein (DUF2064 family)